MGAGTTRGLHGAVSSMALRRSRMGVSTPAHLCSLRPEPPVLASPSWMVEEYYYREESAQSAAGP
jgi:hypothetical protein